MAIVSVTEPTIAASQAASPSTDKAALAMVTTLFFMWGFLTSLNDILVPHLKSIFDLNYSQVMMVQFSFFFAYFVFALPSGKLIEAVGYQTSMVAGLFTMGVGALLFIPAASVPSFPLFLSALIVLAGGMTILQVSANPYVAVLGPPKTASSRLNLTQAFNSLGTTIGPPLGGFLILSSAPMAMNELRKLAPLDLQAYRVQQASSVKLPYLGLALVLIALAIVIALVKLPKISSSHTSQPGDLEDSIWRHRHLLLGAIGIFAYVGAEVSIGSFLINYMSQPDIGNITEKVAAGYVSFYWGGAMIGRFIGAGILQKIDAGKVLGISAIMACLFVVASMLSVGHIAMWTILAVGLFNSIMFPNIFTLGIDGLGSLTGKGSGLMICAVVGGALIPELQGIIADRIGIHHAFFIPAICYLYIMCFAFWGSQHESATPVLATNAA
jgi:MFS transporter, FHS family, L-fucose permease